MKKTKLSPQQAYLMCSIGEDVLFGILMGVSDSGTPRA